MNIFGWTVTVRRRVSAQQSRADRNAAAMTGCIGTAALPGEQLGARIHRDEIALAEAVLRAAKKENSSARLMYPTCAHTDLDFDVDRFVAVLHERLGGAAAVEANPQFAAILPHDVAVIEQAVTDLAKHAFLTLSEHLVQQGRVLLEDLHQRLGHAQAVHFLGNVAVLPAMGSIAAERL